MVERKGHRRWETWGTLQAPAHLTLMAQLWFLAGVKSHLPS